MKNKRLRGLHPEAASLVTCRTLVSFGTERPELVTSGHAGLNQSPGIAYGNGLGSNIANTLPTGGASAMICPIGIARFALRRGAMVIYIGVALTRATAS